MFRHRRGMYRRVVSWPRRCGRSSEQHSHQSQPMNLHNRQQLFSLIIIDTDTIQLVSLLHCQPVSSVMFLWVLRVCYFSTLAATSHIVSVSVSRWQLATCIHVMSALFQHIEVSVNSEWRLAEIVRKTGYWVDNVFHLDTMSKYDTQTESDSQTNW